MLYIFRLLFLLIHIDQETVFNWFGIENPAIQKAHSELVDNYYLSLFNIKIEQLTNVSIDALDLLIESLLNKLQDGLTIVDMENSLFFILFVRFIILAIRYNLKTSFYITCIGLFAGYLWYRHLLDIISTYSNVLVKIPFLQNFRKDGIESESMSPHLSSPGQVVYSGIMRSIVSIDPETGKEYYIDPLSMIVSKIQQSDNSDIILFYDKLYNKIIPKVYDVCSKFWAQLSGIAAYATITRIGKRYCPYLIRWHWTFLLIIMMIEQIFITFINRANYFQTQVLLPQVYDNYLIGPQINFLNIIITSIVLTHIGLLIFGLFHAIWGQYFYLPFFVKNTELHIGPRPKNSIYSGGKTSWQDSTEKEKASNRGLPKVWYGWFGRGTKDEWQISSQLKQFVNKIIKNLKKQFR